MGLLDYVTTHAMDEDYEFVSEQRARAGDAGGDGTGTSGRSRVGLAGGLVMVLFAVLVVTAGVQTSRNSASNEKERRELLAQVDQERAQVNGDRTELASLQRQVNELQTRQLNSDTSAKGVLDDIKLLGMRAGTLPVRGPGVKVVADDAPGADSARNEVLDSDLQKLVNGLWEAGAEAISLNGQRLTNLSTIRLAGNAITVNAHSLRRPYVISAIGNKDTLPARFAETSSGQAWLDLQREVGLRLKITPVSSLRLPAAEVSLRYANQKKTGGAS
jgi:uncharacterized protein YlxW (UPF0749 family)